ncbi:ABC transporter ATP-binding protein [Paludibacterium sp. B53371]|uniref:ABC transporter ATP-binding protein n=1 Tax=Paludibacterium sp. B53371 TaxID=2806263 RepID=UPI001C05D4A4|nr:ABC transporter ATP-binding protein [Paludibacterium sp. B53371]
MIKISGVNKRYGGWSAVTDLNLKIPAGQFTSLIGPPGSGKSTLLKLINRLVEPDTGLITVDGHDINSQAPEMLRRQIGYVIQSVGLFPHWTVAQNIAAVPALLKWPASRIDQQVDSLMALLELPPERFRQRYPHQLSAGQQQRVALARAMAAEPSVLLLDDPFGGVDALTRQSLQQALVRIHKQYGKTVLLVTHDLDEALRLGERIVVMDQGQVVQQGTPREVLLAPGCAFLRQWVDQSDVGVRLLALDRVEHLVRRNVHSSGQPIAADCTLREALSIFIARHVSCLPVADAQGQMLGTLHFTDLLDVTR